MKEVLSFDRGGQSSIPTLTPTDSLESITTQLSQSVPPAGSFQSIPSFLSIPQSKINTATQPFIFQKNKKLPFKQGSILPSLFQKDSIISSSSNHTVLKDTSSNHSLKNQVTLLTSSASNSSNVMNHFSPSNSNLETQNKKSFISTPQQSSRFDPSGKRTANQRNSLFQELGIGMDDAFYLGMDENLSMTHQLNTQPTPKATITTATRIMKDYSTKTDGFKVPISRSFNKSGNIPLTITQIEPRRLNDENPVEAQHHTHTIIQSVDSIDDKIETPTPVGHQSFALSPMRMNSRLIDSINVSQIGSSGSPKQNLSEDRMERNLKQRKQKVNVQNTKQTGVLVNYPRKELNDRATLIDSYPLQSEFQVSQNTIESQTNSESESCPITPRSMKFLSKACNKVDVYVTNIESQLKNYAKQMSELKHDLDSKVTQIRVQSNSSKDLEAEKSKMTVELKRLNVELKIKVDAIVELQLKNDTMQVTADELNQKFETALKTIDQKSMDFTEMITAKNNLQTELNLNREQYYERGEIHAERREKLELEIESKREAYFELERKLAEKDILHLEQLQTEKRRSDDLLANNCRDGNSKIESLEFQVVGLREELVSTGNSLKNLTIEHGELNKTYDEFIKVTATTSNDYEERLGKLREELLGLRDERDELSESIGEMEESIESANTLSYQQGIQITNSKSVIVEFESRIISLQMELKDALELIAKKELTYYETSESLKGEIKVLKTLNTDMKKSITSLNSRIDNHTTESDAHFLDNAESIIENDRLSKVILDHETRAASLMFELQESRDNLVDSNARKCHLEAESNQLLLKIESCTAIITENDNASLAARTESDRKIQLMISDNKVLKDENDSQIQVNMTEMYARLEIQYKDLKFESDSREKIRLYNQIKTAESSNKSLALATENTKLKKEIARLSTKERTTDGKSSLELGFENEAHKSMFSKIEESSGSESEVEISETQSLNPVKYQKNSTQKYTQRVVKETQFIRNSQYSSIVKDDYSRPTTRSLSRSDEKTDTIVRSNVPAHSKIKKPLVGNTRQDKIDLLFGKERLKSNEKARIPLAPVNTLKAVGKYAKGMPFKESRHTPRKRPVDEFESEEDTVATNDMFDMTWL